MTTTAVWGLSFVILANGILPNPETMDYQRTKTRQECIELAHQKWRDYYSKDTYNKNLFTLCTAYPANAAKSFWLTCDQNAVCTA